MERLTLKNCWSESEISIFLFWNFLSVKYMEADVDCILPTVVIQFQAKPCKP